MFSSLPQATRDELEQLAQRYGQPLTRVVDLDSHTMFDPLNRTDRYGEVCMVVRRRNGRLLIMKKTMYPPGAHRLLTGGINHGESIYDALLRETREETGLEAAVKHFLAAVAYRTPITGDAPTFYTFAFLLDEIGGTFGTLDEDEQVEEFLEIEPERLLAIANYMEHIEKAGSDGASIEVWRDWGQFRAVIHRLVWQALHSPVS
jgi:8-oxo-dGTP pyrophosphatase MutT (NUDIX family)